MVKRIAVLPPQFARAELAAREGKVLQQIFEEETNIHLNLVSSEHGQIATV